MEVEKLLTLHRVPFGSYMIKEGEIPKGIFFLLKGSASQRLEVRGSQGDKQQLTVTHYSAGDCFPKESLSECLPFSIVAESPCEVVSLPKGCLRTLGCDRKGLMFKGEDFYRGELQKQGEWEEFKINYLASTIKTPQFKPKPMIF
jgi:CRP-like cAMP-binding protein